MSATLSQTWHAAMLLTITSLDTKLLWCREVFLGPDDVKAIFFFFFSLMSMS